MTPREIAAFNAGIRTAREAALIVAITLETRAGSTCVRDRAAIQAMQGFAEGLDALVLGREADPMQRVLVTINSEDDERLLLAHEPRPCVSSGLQVPNESIIHETVERARQS